MKHSRWPFMILLLVLTLPLVSHAANETMGSSAVKEPSWIADNSIEDGDEAVLDYQWVYLDCFHDSQVKRKCPVTAGAKGYKWSMIKGECARSYWKCFGSH